MTGATGLRPLGATKSTIHLTLREMGYIHGKMLTHGSGTSVRRTEVLKAPT